MTERESEGLGTQMHLGKAIDRQRERKWNRALKLQKVRNDER